MANALPARDNSACRHDENTRTRDSLWTSRASRRLKSYHVFFFFPVPSRSLRGPGIAVSKAAARKSKTKVSFFLSEGSGYAALYTPVPLPLSLLATPFVIFRSVSFKLLATTSLVVDSPARSTCITSGPTTSLSRFLQRLLSQRTRTCSFCPGSFLSSRGPTGPPRAGGGEDRKEKFPQTRISRGREDVLADVNDPEGSPRASPGRTWPEKKRKIANSTGKLDDNRELVARLKIHPAFKGTQVRGENTLSRISKADYGNLHLRSRSKTRRKKRERSTFPKNRLPWRHMEVGWITKAQLQFRRGRKTQREKAKGRGNNGTATRKRRRSERKEITRA